MAHLPHNDSLVATVGEFAAMANITSNSSYYDDYVYVHSDLNPTIHFTGKGVVRHPATQLLTKAKDSSSRSIGTLSGLIRKLSRKTVDTQELPRIGTGL